MTTTATEKAVLYPPQRVVEHAVALDGVPPRRLFALLWPLWRVEIEAEVEERQAYEVLDKFISKGIKAGLSTVGSLAAFFGLRPSLVDRVLGFLELIKHVERLGDTVKLSPLGERAVQEGVRYEPKKTRQFLLFDKATMRPLPRAHYSGGLTLLDEPALPVGSRYGLNFTTLFTPTAFVREAVSQLRSRADRAEYNLPAELTDLHDLGEREVYLPVYLVETASTRTPYLVYSKVAGDRDAFLESLCGGPSVVASLARAEPDGDPHEIWTTWLSERQLPASALRRLPNGVWRATLPPSSFGTGGDRFTLSRLGSYVLRRQHFLQLWCDRVALRRAAVLHRVSLMRRLRSRRELREQLAAVARQLEVPVPSVDDLTGHVAEAGKPELWAWVEGLSESEETA